MTTMVQLGATSWLNIDLVTMVHCENDQWLVRLSGEERPITLEPEPGKTLEFYLRTHSESTAYNKILEARDRQRVFDATRGR